MVTQCLHNDWFGDGGYDPDKDSAIASQVEDLLFVAVEKHRAFTLAHGLVPRVAGKGSLFRVAGSNPTVVTVRRFSLLIITRQRINRVSRPREHEIQYSSVGKAPGSE